MMIKYFNEEELIWGDLEDRTDLQPKHYDLLFELRQEVKQLRDYRELKKELINFSMLPLFEKLNSNYGTNLGEKFARKLLVEPNEVMKDYKPVFKDDFGLNELSYFKNDMIYSVINCIANFSRRTKDLVFRLKIHDVFLEDVSYKYIENKSCRPWMKKALRKSLYR